MHSLNFFKTALLLSITTTAVWSAEVQLTPRELFRVPFGTAPEQLGTKIDNDQLLIPRDFTLDKSGHFYINDVTNHRIVRYDDQGHYEISFRYPETAKNVFIQTDTHQNLWLLISDPTRGIYYGVYDMKGKKLRDGVFGQYDQFHLHVDDDGSLHALLSSTKTNNPGQAYFFDEAALLLKHETIARPPEDHHQIRRQNKTYYTDLLPGGSKNNAPVTRISDTTQKHVASIEGTVMYITWRGDIYTRLGLRDLHIYNADGALEGKVHLDGLSASCDNLRFDNDGNIYQLDGIPDPADKNNPTAEGDEKYSAKMSGMRLIQWQTNR